MLTHMAEPTEDQLNQVHQYVEEFLTDLRRSQWSDVGAKHEDRFGTEPNGLVIHDSDGGPSNVIRVRTRWACRMIIQKFLEVRGEQVNEKDEEA